MLWFLLAVIGFLIWAFAFEKKPNLNETDDDRRVREQAERLRQRDRADRWTHGHKNVEMVCPHCDTRGEVRTKSKQVKKGVSGGKAAGAILTGGVSLLATGLSRREGMTEAHCGNCHNKWMF